MTVPNWIRLRRITGLGALLMLALLAAAMMAGPAVAHHGPGHDGGPPGGDKGTNEAATFTFGVSDDIVGSVKVTKTVSKNQSGIHTGGVGADLKLNMSVFVGKNATSTAGVSGADWDNCFAGGPFSGNLAVEADKKDPGTGWVSFWFAAKGKDGTTEIWYNLAVTRVEIEPLPAVWPYWLPAVGDTVTVTTKAGEPWKLQHNAGPGKKVACTGDGTTGKGTNDTLDFVIAIKRIAVAWAEGLVQQREQKYRDFYPWMR